MGCGSISSAEKVKHKEFQDLSGWESYSLADLLKSLDYETDAEVRVYNVASTHYDKDLNVIQHRGSGPNLEGGLATLCTCKHSMRKGADGWKGKWILGVTSRAIAHGFDGKHYLFYLIKIAKSCDSHKDLYEKYWGCKNFCVNGIGSLPRHPVFKLDTKAV